MAIDYRLVHEYRSPASREPGRGGAAADPSAGRSSRAGAGRRPAGGAGRDRARRAPRLLAARPRGAEGRAAGDDRRRAAALPPLGAAELARNAAAAPAQLPRRVRLRGRWAAERTVYLDNRQMRGRPASSSSRRCGSRQPRRCWCSAAGCRATSSTAALLPAVLTPTGRVEVVGRIAAAAVAAASSSTRRASGPIRQNLDLDAFARETGLACCRCRCSQTRGRPARDGLERDWPPPAPTCTSTTATRSSGSPSRARSPSSMSGSELVRPRQRRRAPEAPAAGLDRALDAVAGGGRGRADAHPPRPLEDAAGAAGVRRAGDRLLLHLLRSSAPRLAATTPS